MVHQALGAAAVQPFQLSSHVKRPFEGDLRKVKGALPNTTRRAMSGFDIAKSRPVPNVSLTPELERFAEECVRAGRYGNVSEVARAALRLLQDTERKRQEFLAMLGRVEAEGEAAGFVSADEVAAELDTVIAEAEERPSP
jgi:antitoxin ParD1/3/4